VVQSGKVISNECGVVFEKMEVTLQGIAETMNAIHAAANEQEQGVKQATAAMLELEKVTQSNTQSSDSLASKAATLNASAQSLKTVVEMMQKNDSWGRNSWL
jgi:methyl-accepting chemotaxis protein